MEKYHEKEANRARHNQYAASCGFVDFLLFDVLLRSDTCDKR